MKRKNILYASFLLGVVAIFAFLVLAGTLKSTPNLTSPVNNTNYSGTLILNATMNYTLEFNNTTSNMTFYFNNSSSGVLVYNITVGPENQDLNDTFNTTIASATFLPDGNYTVSVMANNSSGSDTTGDTSWNDTGIEIQIDNTAPLITINTANNSFLGNVTTSLSFNVTIIETGSGMHTVNLSNNTRELGTESQVGNDWNLTVYATNLTTGENTLKAYANDTITTTNGGNNNNNSVITVWLDDAVGPTVNLEVKQYLQNYTWTTDTTPTLYYNFTDDFSPNASCELFVDEAGAGVNSTVLNDTQTPWTVNRTLSIGVHKWYVNCTDLGSFTNSSLETSDKFYLDVVNPINVSTPSNYSWTTETRQDNVSFTFNFLSGLINSSATNNITCELYITSQNSSGLFTAHGVNTTALNNTVMTIRNNQTLLNDSTGNLNYGPNVNWTMNCTFNGSSITQALNDDFWILNIDNSTPGVPTMELSSSTSSSLTVAVTAASDILTCTDDDPDTDLSGSGSSWTIEIGGLGASTPHTFQVSCSDYAGNSETSLTYSYTTDSVSGSGTGGSGGGISSSTAGQYEKTVWASVNAGETATVEVDNGVIGVTAVEFKVKETTYGAWVEVQKIDELPEDVSAFDAAGKVYRNIKITANNVETVLDGTAAIKFKVEKAWLEDSGVGKSDVALFRFIDGEWTKLVTTMDSDDGTYVHYTAQTEGFSYFVIAWEGGEAVPTLEEVGGEAGEGEAGEGAAEGIIKGMSKGWIITLVVLVVAIAVVVFFWMRKRK